MDTAKKEIENSLKDIKEDDIPADKKLILLLLWKLWRFFNISTIEFNLENDPYAAFNRVKEILSWKFY